MNYRTDLAVETAEMLEKVKSRRAEYGRDDAESKDCDTGNEGGNSMNNQTGYIVKRSQLDEDISVTEIEITDEEGEKAFGKRRGRYVTVEVQGILEPREKIKERAAAVLSDELAKFVKHDYFLRVLAVGLGNEKVTPDSLGPHTVDKLHVTSHLFKLFECSGDEDYSNVCAFNPSVTGVTGLETAELIERVVSMAKPDAVLAIDALAAKDIARLSSTVQICDTGIMPGSGMGNHRREISERTVGCPVIAIGVPTVIDARTLIMEAAERLGELQESEHAVRLGGSRLADGGAEGEPASGEGGVASASRQKARQTSGGDTAACAAVPAAQAQAACSIVQQPASPLEKYLASSDLDMIVTSTDIDQIIKDFSDIIANAINITLHPGIYSKVNL